MNNRKKHGILIKQSGSTLVTALVFLGVFLVLSTALLSYVTLEIRVAARSHADAQAFAIAEAGVEYYRWHLAHAPDDFTDGTGNPGPYRHEYRDPQGDVVGTFELEIIPRDPCSSTTRILSRGWTTDVPDRVRTVAISRGSPALTTFSYLTNSNIWFGGNEELKGDVHSNGGIRMDADNSGRMTSAKATYICGSEHGCRPPTTKPGVWGEGKGGKNGLWDFPTPVINFSLLALDLARFKEQAQGVGTYFGPSKAFGYHTKLGQDGRVEIFKVTGVGPGIWGYDGRSGWVETIEDIASEVLMQTITVPSKTQCGTASLLFFDDTLWVNGEATRPVTLVTPLSLFINGNITTPEAQEKEGAIGLVAGKDVLIPLHSPSTLELHAAVFAQQGHYFRNFYCDNEFYNRYGWKCKSSYRPSVLRDSLELKGTVVTNQIAATAWVDTFGRVISGYRGGENTYDTDLIVSPPPFFPRQGEDRILTWEEITK